jgi:perosamine synthetase
VLKSGYLTGGQVTRAFEKEFAEYVGTRYAVAVSSGTAALHLALLGSGVGERSEVILPSFTYHASAAAVIQCGARPVLVDADTKTMCINPEEISHVLSDKTRAIIVTHFAGHPCDMKPIQQIAGKRHLAIIEDAAHAIGSAYHKKRIGSLGDAGCFSFYPTKSMTTGEGGMITTDNSGLAEKVRMMRSLCTKLSHGIQYDASALGFTYRMSELQAALGRDQLRRLDRTVSTIRRKARRMLQMLRDIPGLVLPYEAPYATHTYNLFVARIIPEEFGLNRDQVSKRLKRKGIETQLHYVPLHRLTFYSKMAKFRTNALKVSDSLWKTAVSLPLYPTIRDSDLERVSTALHQIGETH